MNCRGDCQGGRVRAGAEPDAHAGSCLTCRSSRHTYARVCTCMHVHRCMQHSARVHTGTIYTDTCAHAEGHICAHIFTHVQVKPDSFSQIVTVSPAVTSGRGRRELLQALWRLRTQHRWTQGSTQSTCVPTHVSHQKLGIEPISQDVHAQNPPENPRVRVDSGLSRLVSVRSRVSR